MRRSASRKVGTGFSACGLPTLCLFQVQTHGVADHEVHAALERPCVGTECEKDSCPGCPGRDGVASRFLVCQLPTSLEGARWPLPRPPVVHLVNDLESFDLPVTLVTASTTSRGATEVTACTNPLFGLERMEVQRPGVIRAWLDWHINQIGIHRFAVYDLDGSFANVIDMKTDPLA